MSLRGRHLAKFTVTYNLAAAVGGEVGRRVSHVGKLTTLHQLPTTTASRVIPLVFLQSSSAKGDAARSKWTCGSRIFTSQRVPEGGRGQLELSCPCSSQWVVAQTDRRT